MRNCKGQRGQGEYSVPLNSMILVKVGDEIKKGDILTDGSADIDELFKYAGKEKTINYVIHEINKPYELQGETVSRKHIETIVRQMFSRRKIKNPGDTVFSAGDMRSGQSLVVRAINEGRRAAAAVTDWLAAQD